MALAMVCAYTHIDGGGGGRTAALSLDSGAGDCEATWQHLAMDVWLTRFPVSHRCLSFLFFCRHRRSNWKVLEESNYKQLKMNACPRMGYIDTEGAVKAAAERFKAVREAVGTYNDRELLKLNNQHACVRACVRACGMVPFI